MKTKLGLRADMIILFVILVTFSCLILVGISYQNAKKMAKELTKNALTMKMDGDINATKKYVAEYLGTIQRKEGKLTDASGIPIEGNNAMVDAIQDDLGVVATIFAKENNDFRRITTNIKKDDGSRAVGTLLGQSSAAYTPIMNKQLFIGEAVILGKSYLTAYKPILADDQSLIGILFVGIPQDEITGIVKERTHTLLLHSAIGFVIILVIVISATVWIATALSRGISQCGSQLNTGAHQVNIAAEQLSQASNSLAEGTTEQAASLEETASSLEELSAMTKSNVTNSIEANKLAEQAKFAASNGADSMHTMVSAINEIQSSANETAKIVKVIDEIAFQTNLLALNAAVEAARAGEAGKGFAVVAEEVRNLAKRSADAAKTTTDLIGDSVKNADNGVRISHQVNAIFADIVSATTKTTDIMSEITHANTEQAQGISQINEAVSQIDIVTQRNAAHAEESASAATELTAQSESMHNVVVHLHTLINGGKE